LFKFGLRLERKQAAGHSPSVTSQKISLGWAWDCPSDPDALTFLWARALDTNFQRSSPVVDQAEKIQSQRIGATPRKMLTAESHGRAMRFFYESLIAPSKTQDVWPKKSTEIFKQLLERSSNPS